MLMEPVCNENSLILEDMGLFQGGMTRTQVAMTPIFGQNNRGDWIVSAVLPDGKEFQVVFAGRRAQAVGELRAELSRIWSSAVRNASARQQDRPEPHSVSMPVLIEGSWRAVFRRDGEGWETRQYQLYAARWSFVCRDGDVEVAGEAPLSYGETVQDPASAQPVRHAAQGAGQ